MIWVALAGVVLVLHFRRHSHRGHSGHRGRGQSDKVDADVHDFTDRQPDDQPSSQPSVAVAITAHVRPPGAIAADAQTNPGPTREPDSGRLPREAS